MACNTNNLVTCVGMQGGVPLWLADKKLFDIEAFNSFVRVYTNLAHHRAASHGGTGAPSSYTRLAAKVLKEEAVEVPSKPYPIRWVHLHAAAVRTDSPPIGLFM